MCQIYVACGNIVIAALHIMQNKNKIPKMTENERAALQAFKNFQEKKKTTNPYRKDAVQAVKAREALTNLPESLEERQQMTAQVWADHGKSNPNKKTNF